MSAIRSDWQCECIVYVFLFWLQLGQPRCHTKDWIDIRKFMIISDSARSVALSAQAWWLYECCFECTATCWRLSKSTSAFITLQYATDIWQVLVKIWRQLTCFTNAWSVSCNPAARQPGDCIKCGLTYAKAASCEYLYNGKFVYICCCYGR